MPNMSANTVRAKPGTSTFTTPCSVLKPPAVGQYYVYCSGPKAFSKNKGSHNKVRKIVDYHSVMWDPHVYRGPTYKTFKKSEEERCMKKKLEDASLKNQQRKKGLTNGRVQERNKFGAMIRAYTPPNLSSKVGLSDMSIQTDRFLEEITDEVNEKEMSTQTDYVYDLPVAKIFIPAKFGIDAETQILPWELFCFDEEVAPIVSNIVGKIIEQALFETMEEMELTSLLAQQRGFEERHRIDLVRLDRLHKREQKITKERQRLIENRRREVEEEIETENHVNATLFSINYLCGVADAAVNVLRRIGFMSGNDDLQDSFIPWLNEQSTYQFKLQDNSLAILDEIIQGVVVERETQVVDEIWREISAEHQEMLPEDFEEENETVPMPGQGENEEEE